MSRSSSASSIQPPIDAQAIPAAALPLLDQIPREVILSYLAARPATDAPTTTPTPTAATPTRNGPTVRDVTQHPESVMHFLDDDARARHDEFIRQKVAEGRDGPTCMGCEDLSCIEDWNHDSVLRNMARSNFEEMQWLEGHKFFGRRRCPEHPDSEMVFRPARVAPNGKEIPAYLECRARVEGKTNPCRLRVGMLYPFLSNTSKKIIETANIVSDVSPTVNDDSSSSDDEEDVADVETDEVAVETFAGEAEVLRVTNCVTPMILMFFWALCAIGANRKAKAAALNVSVKVVTRLQRLLAQCAWRHHFFSRPALMVNLQVDEVFMGKRKAHRGKRARKVGQWFVSVTEVDRKTGHTMRTRWYPVVRRDKQTLVNIVRRHVASAKATVTTDEFAGYSDLTFLGVCRHRTVCHKTSFKSPEGYHTNNAEGGHSLVKRGVREESRRYGCTPAVLQANVALQCLKLDKDHPEEVGTWLTRFRNILRFVRASYYYLSSPIQVVEADPQADLPPAPVPAAKHSVVAVPDHDIPFTLPSSLMRKTAEYCWHKLRPNMRIESHAIFLTLTEEIADGNTIVVDPEVLALVRGGLENAHTVDISPLPPAGAVDGARNIVLPVLEGEHWVLFCYDKVLHEIVYYDSLGTPAPALVFEMEILINRMVALGTPAPTRNGGSTIQQQGSNDCGLFVVNNAMQWREGLVPARTHTRESLRGLLFHRTFSEHMWRRHLGSQPAYAVADDDDDNASEEVEGDDSMSEGADLSQVLSQTSAAAWGKAHERQEAQKTKKEEGERSRKEKKEAKRLAKEAKRREKEARARRDRM